MHSVINNYIPHCWNWRSCCSMKIALKFVYILLHYSHVYVLVHSLMASLYNLIFLQQIATAAR
jgi:hypothetical protein